MAEFDYKEYARQMRENCYKDENGNIICSDELWEHIASIIESTADVVPKSEVEKLEKESSAFAEIIHKQEDEIQQLRKSLLTKQALEEEFSKSVKKIEKQALKTIEKAKQEVARGIFEEIENRAYSFGACFVEMTRTTFDEIKKKYTKEG